MAELSESVNVPADVLIREIDGETVLLNLDDEAYYGLDDVSTDFWQAITSTDSLQAALDQLAGMYDVDYERLTGDFQAFVGDLLANGLLTSDSSSD